MDHPWPRHLVVNAGFFAGTVLGIVLCRIFVVRRVKRLLHETSARAVIHVDTPAPWTPGGSTVPPPGRR